ncbi:MAG TPA: hypothetical protein VFV34_05475, partial [Blastocatellia bacterium]|nr:hypothetical protein [Blastocatellia bacterium]
MRQISMAILISLVVVAAFPPERSTADDPRQAEVRTDNKLVGTWKQVSGKFNGKEFRPPAGTTLIKHVTPTQFMFVDYDKDGKVTDAFGGPYTLKGDKYEETPVYGVGDVHGLKGKTLSFTCKVEGNKWHHSGTLRGGATIEEVWER